MKDVIKFEMPIFNKVSTNQMYRGWTHWSVRSKMKDEFQSFLVPFKNRFKISSFPVRITYSFEWKTRALDTTNQTAMMKLFEDGMKVIGLLPDDTPEYVRESVSRSTKGKADLVKITIEPCE